MELNCGVSFALHTTRGKKKSIHQSLILQLRSLTKIRARVFGFLLILAVASLLPKSSVSATSYSVSFSTSGSVELDGLSGIDIESSNLSITSTCRAGYHLSLATSVSDNNLYRSGDSSNNASGTYISPSDGLTALTSATNTWGYSLGTLSQGQNNESATILAPTVNDIFLPVPTSSDTPVILKSPEQTASPDSDIADSFSVYYGVSASANLTAGSYQMIEDNATNTNGALVYYLTMAPSCIENLNITFNENLDGAGAEGTDSTLANFPASSENTLDSTNHTLTLSSKTPTRTDYTFKEWNTEADGTGDYYYPGAIVAIGVGANPNHTNATDPNGSNTEAQNGDVTLYAIWIPDCASGYICYDGNGAGEGTMDPQETTSGTVTLIASNFSRAGYGFTGWNTAPDGSGTQYGPNQHFAMPSSGGVNLYAQWLASTGTLQTWAGASNMNIGDVIALQDNRDDEVYTVAKLADGNVWIVENLRLVPNTAHITDRNTNHPTSSFLSDYSSSSSSTGQCFTNNTTCVDQINFNSHNLNRTLTPNYKSNANDAYWYSYGVMYNWYTATAGNGTYDLTSNNAAGDLCPVGWHLPSGGTSGEWSVLASSMTGGTDAAKSATLRSYPNNFIYSGDYNPEKDFPDGVGIQGRLWSTTPVGNNTKNAYRMGYNSDGITAATTNSWNKWDNFAIRCIYQGGNVPYEDVHVNFQGTGITSLTFTNANYPTETATPGSPTINLAQDVTYTVTATTSTGYEVTSWATTSTGTLGDTTTVNPAPITNTYTITNESTLTITGQAIPSYEAEVTLGEHVTSVSFAEAELGTTTITPQSASCTNNNDNTYTCTVNLRRGLTYALSSTFEPGYTIDEWIAGASSTIGDTTTTTTTFSITGNTTLTILADETDGLEYTLVYSAGSGADAPTSDTIISYDVAQNFTITNRTPIYYGYTLAGWSETADANNNGTTVDYVAGDTISIASTGAVTSKTLYPVYQTVTNCPAGKICYYDNGADVTGGGRGTMANRSVTSGGTTKLIPTNYSRTGSGFAGWTTAENATPYGPNETIAVGDISSSGLALYAKWVPSTGDLQTWNGCNSMNTNDVIALTDTRDNNVYAVAKLADGNCWTIENLRLDPSTASITAQNTHNPATSFATEASGSSSSNSLCATDDDSECINQFQYNTNNLNRSLTQSHNTAGDSVAWYSYGVYYNWYTATAGNGTYNTSANANVAGDLCPKNWHLPTSTSNGEWVTLNNVVNGGISNADANLRVYPVNLIWSGDYNGASRTSGYSNGRYWSATSQSNNNAYRMGHQDSHSSKGAQPRGYYSKWDAFAIRCIRDEVAAEPGNSTPPAEENSPASSESPSNTNNEPMANAESLTPAPQAQLSSQEPANNTTTENVEEPSPDDTYVASQGVTTNPTRNLPNVNVPSSAETDQSSLGLAVIAGTAAATGAAALVYTKKHESEDAE